MVAWHGATAIRATCVPRQVDHLPGLKLDPPHTQMGAVVRPECIAPVPARCASPMPLASGQMKHRGSSANRRGGHPRILTELGIVAPQGRAQIQASGPGCSRTRPCPAGHCSSRSGELDEKIDGLDRKLRASARKRRRGSAADDDPGNRTDHTTGGQAEAGQDIEDGSARPGTTADHGSQAVCPPLGTVTSARPGVRATTGTRTNPAPILEFRARGQDPIVLQNPRHLDPTALSHRRQRSAAESAHH